jgi:hypothetical protein
MRAADATSLHGQRIPPAWLLALAAACVLGRSVCEQADECITTLKGQRICPQRRDPDDPCGGHLVCEACRANGCAWCIAARLCVEDKPWKCTGEDDHIGNVGKLKSCPAPGDAQRPATWPPPPPRQHPSPRPQGVTPGVSRGAAAPDAARFLQQMEVLDWDARIFKVESFLSDEECDDLVALGHEVLTEQHGDSWRTTHAYATTFFRAEDYRRSELLRSFEERVARLTMVKGHADEAPAMFTRQIPGTVAGSFISDQALRNVHHDKNMRENRVVTVLLYLSTAADGDGGHTLFPCLPAKAGGKAGGKLAQTMAADLKTLFDAGTRVLDDRITGPDEIALLERCNAQCRMAHKAQLLSVQPVKGTAVVFWNVEADGQPNHKVWHSACQALSGPHRYALQKFKELPRVSGEWVLDPTHGKPRWQPRARDEL